MSRQVQITVDQEVYDRLRELCAPPYLDINEVVRGLLRHEGHDTAAVIALKADERHRSFEDEIAAAQAGVYDSACP